MALHQRNPSSSNFTALRRHEEFFLTGGDLFFLVEHYQFRVHRYFFERESDFFRGKLTAPASPGAIPQGSSESTAIVLDNVRSNEFARFLWVFYNPKYSLYKASPEDWAIILELAHRWSFPEVKLLAVRELEKLQVADIDRIHIYQKFEVDRTLLVGPYVALCKRQMPLTLPEGNLLGMQTALMIARARECVRSNPAASGLRSPTPANIEDSEMSGIVKDLFGIGVPSTSSEATTSTASAPPKIDTTNTGKPAVPPKNAPTNGSANGNGATNGAPATNGTSSTNGTTTNGTTTTADAADAAKADAAKADAGKGSAPESDTTNATTTSSADALAISADAFASLTGDSESRPQSPLNASGRGRGASGARGRGNTGRGR